jgi:hypothetical protein
MLGLTLLNCTTHTVHNLLFHRSFAFNSTFTTKIGGGGGGSIVGEATPLDLIYK